MNRLSSICTVAAILCFVSLVAAQEKVTFDDHVAPIFNKRCATCHNSGKRSGDLDVTNFTNLMQGGSSGTVIEPGDSSGSYLYTLVTHEDSPEMPPSGKIPDAEIAMVAKWIDGGALENQGSKAMIAKPKFDLSMSGSATVRPEVAPLSARLPLQPVIETKTPGTITAIATSPWAPIAAVAAARQVLLFDTNTLQLIGVIPTEGKSNVLKFSRSGAVLLMSNGLEGAGAKIRLWDVREGKTILELGNEADTILAADINPDLSLVAVGGPQKLVRVYSTADSSLVYEIKKHTDWVTALEFSPDGEYLASGDRNGGLHVWLADSGAEYLTLKAHTKMISGVSWRWDAKVVASGSEDGSIRLWEPEEGKQIKSWGGHGGGLTSLEFTRDGHIVSCGRDRVSKIWQQDGKALRNFGGLNDVATSVSFCDESSRMITADWAGTINVHQSSDGKAVGQLAANPPGLESRIQAANQVLQQRTAAHQPLAAKVVELTKSLTGTQATLTQVTTARDQLKAQVAAVQANVNNTRQQLEATQAQQVEWRKQLDAQKVALPAVQNAKTSAEKAVQTLPADAEMKQVVAQLTTKLQQVNAKVAELTQLVSNSDKKKVETEANLKTLNQSLMELQGKLQQREQELAQLDKQVGQLNDQLAAAKTQASAAKAQLDQAAAQANRWKAELEFVQKLNALSGQLKSAEQDFVAKATAAEEKALRLKEVQAEVDQANQLREAAKNSMSAIEAQIKQLKNVK